MKVLDRDENETYKFLGCKLAEKIDMKKKVMGRLQIQMMKKRIRKLVGEELYDKNLVKA